MPNKATIICCVPGCNKPRSETTILHKFPDPKKDPERFRTWLYAAGGDLLALNNDAIYKYRRICHIHFMDKYHTISKQLTRNSVPSLHLPVFVELLNNNRLDDVDVAWKQEPGGQMSPDIKYKHEENNEDLAKPLVPHQEPPRQYTILYPMVLIFAYWHIGALYGLYLGVTSAKRATIFYNFLIYMLGGFGITAGAHRLWSHRAYKARLPLQILLMLFQTMSCQKSVLNWVRDHRLHHKYCDTDADPHNSTRGLFYSHIGWLMVPKHPETIKRGKTLDMSDLKDNPVLQFQKKYYLVLMPILAFLQYLLIPVVFWEESITNSHFVGLVTLVVGSHVTFAINSVAHAFGSKPYDRNISPSQNVPLSLFAFGEGYHNYHHVFPNDYRVAELGNNSLNFSTNFIDFFAWIGWAYDLKYATDDLVAKRAERTGDGTDLWGQMKKGVKAN